MQENSHSNGWPIVSEFFIKTKIHLFIKQESTLWALPVLAKASMRRCIFYTAFSLGVSTSFALTKQVEYQLKGTKEKDLLSSALSAAIFQKDHDKAVAFV